MEKVEWRARKLRAARALAKLSQKDLAADAGVNIKAIVVWKMEPPVRDWIPGTRYWRRWPDMVSEIQRAG